MITSINNITNSIQVPSATNVAAKKNTNQSISTDTYEKTTISPYDYTIYGRNYPKDEFEQNLSPDDLKYFVFIQDGSYRIPNVGAPPELKQQWLDYSKKMAAEGFTPQEVEAMDIGSGSGFIWFPPENASTDTKRAWVESLKKMDPLDASLMKQTIKDNLAGPSVKLFSPEYWNRVASGVAGITSYQDIFTACLDGVKEQAAKIPSSGDQELAKKSMKRLETCFDILIETFNKYTIK